jgi:uncharacterized protein (TIGR02268 family)
MRLRSPGVFLVLLLLASASIAQAQVPSCQTETRRIELVAGSAVPHELCISPGLSTTLLFDGALEANTILLEGRERFRRVETAGSLLVLVPSEQLKPGERLRLQVRFAKGVAAESASFVLVVHRDQAERQVEVSFTRRVTDTCQVELRSKEAELQRCLEQHPPLSEGRAGAESLAALVAAGLINQKGLTVLELEAKSLLQTREGALEVKRMTLYRSIKRIALEVELKNSDPVKPWALESAALVGQPGEVLETLSVLQQGLLEPGDTQSIWVELAVPKESARGTFTLQLWDAGKARTLTVPGVKLP